MKKLIYILAVILIFFPLYSTDQPDFPDIYIDADAGDGGVGSQADPYNEFADINWSTGGDNSIYDYINGSPTQNVGIWCQSGDVWREALIIYTSGTSGCRIVIGAYGSGAMPIINSNDVITGWAIYGAGVGSTYYVNDIGSTTAPGTTMVLVDGSTKLTYAADKDNLSEGEFYHDDTDDDLYIRLSGDANPSGYTIEAHERRQGVKAYMRDYIIVDGFHLTGGAEGVWMDWNSSYWTIQNCTIDYHGGHGIKVEGTSGNECTYVTISNNLINNGSGCGRTSGLSPFGMRISHSDNCIFENNTFTDEEYGGIYMDYSDSNVFRYNWIDVNDSNAVTFSASVSNEFYYNIVVHKQGASNFMMEVSTNANTNMIYNNVFYSASTDRGIYINTTSTGNKVKNNVIESSQTNIAIQDGSETNLEVDYNVYTNDSATGFYWLTGYHTCANWLTNSSQDANSSQTDPLMTDPTNDDFTLQSDSPCRDAGTYQGLSRVDYAGNSVPRNDNFDIGAYEYQAGSSGCAIYVDATDGDDTATGTNSTNAWKTISKVNGETFLPGDSVLFQKGEEWCEQLTVLNSGSSGNPITFGTYGTGSKPIINGADLMETWTSYSAIHGKRLF